MELFWDIVRGALLMLHFVGLAMIIGGALHQVKEKAKNVTFTMLHGAYTQVVTGIALVGVAYGAGNGDYVDNWKITVKLAIALAVAVLCFVNRKKTSNNVPVWGTVLLLALVNVGVAIFW